MSSPSQTGTETGALNIYATFLRERNQVLSDLVLASRAMRSMLQTDASAEIKDLLARREQDCMKFAEINKSRPRSDAALLINAEKAARSGQKESASAALSVLSLYEDSQDLANEIMACQSDCESILKTRLKATAKALQESARRRKLDAAYGPACRHDTPFFMDKQT